MKTPKGARAIKEAVITTLECQYEWIIWDLCGDGDDGAACPAAEKAGSEAVAKYINQFEVKLVRIK